MPNLLLTEKRATFFLVILFIAITTTMSLVSSHKRALSSGSTREDVDQQQQPAPKERKIGSHKTIVFFGIKMERDDIDIVKAAKFHMHNKYLKHCHVKEKVAKELEKYDKSFAVGNSLYFEQVGPSIGKDAIKLCAEEQMDEKCTCQGCVLVTTENEAFQILQKELEYEADKVMRHWSIRSFAGVGKFLGTQFQVWESDSAVWTKPKHNHEATSIFMYGCSFANIARYVLGKHSFDGCDWMMVREE